MLLLVFDWFLHLFMVGNLANFNDTNRYGIPTMDKEKRIELKPFQFSCPIIRNSHESVTWSAVPYAIITFLDGSYSASFVVRGQQPRRGR